MFDMLNLKGVVPRQDGSDWAQMRMLVKAFLERREQESGGESSAACGHSSAHQVDLGGTQAELARSG